MTMNFNANRVFARGMRTVAAVALAFMSMTDVAFGAEDVPMLADGTPVRLRLTRNVSSGEARTGDTVDFEVLEDVVVNDVTVIKRGSPAIATVTDALAKRRMGRAGRLDVAIDHVRLTNGEKVALRGIKEGRGGSNAGKVTTGVVVTSLVFWPAAPLFLLAHGKDITIPKGTEITAYTNGDFRLTKLQPAPSPFQNSANIPVVVAAMPTVTTPSMSAPANTSSNIAPAAPASSPRMMSNEDVMAMKAAGLADDVIIAKIRSGRCGFRTDATDIIAMKKSGASDAVLKAMLEAR